MSLAFVLDHRADVDPDGDVISDGSQSGTPWHKTVPARFERVPA
jgi:hypothetical protein